MSNQERQPTRVGLTIGSTTRLNEFDFSKISLSLERDLAATENPLDGFRGIHALLSKALVELQVGPRSQVSPVGDKPKSLILSDNHALPPSPAGKTNSGVSLKTTQTGNETPRSAASKPAGLTVETTQAGNPMDGIPIRERLAKWLPDLEILDGFDGFAVKPKRFLGEVWSEVNEVIRALGGKWVKGTRPADGAWRIPK